MRYVFHAHAQTSMQTVITELLSVSRGQGQRVNIMPAIFGTYVRDAINTLHYQPKATHVVMDVIYNMFSPTFATPPFWKRVQFPEVMRLTGDQQMEAYAKNLGSAFLTRGDHMLLCEGFYKVNGVNDCLIRAFKTVKPLGSLNTLITLPEIAHGQIAYDGVMLVTTTAFDRTIPAVTTTKARLRLVRP